MPRSVVAVRKPRRQLGLAVAGLAFGLYAAPLQAQQVTQATIDALVPDLEKQVAAGLDAFPVPGLAIGIVFEDRLVYAKGFGVRQAGQPAPVTKDTVFQVGSTTKAFFATTLSQAVDAGKLKWNDAFGDHVPAFRLSEPFVSRDFRVLDIAAQRSGLTPYVNDSLAILGFDRDTLVRAMVAAPQVGAFRSDFSYLNIPHLAGGEMVAALNGDASWYASVKRTILDPLGMGTTTATPEAIAQAPDHAVGHRPGEKPVPIPFHHSFPYALGAAGAFNSTVPDMAKWLRLQLGRGHFDGKVVVSEANLDMTWTPRVGLAERVTYGIGWVINLTPRGRVIWHNGGTIGFGAHAGFLPDAKTGIVILTNLGNPALADSLAQWYYDRVMGNPSVDNIALGAQAFRRHQEAERSEAAAFVVAAAPVNPQGLVGSYRSPVLGDATVTFADGRLSMKLERTEAELLLEPNRDDPNLFQARLLATPGFEQVLAMAGDSPILALRFERDLSGRAAVLRWTSADLPHAFRRQPDP